MNSLRTSIQERFSDLTGVSINLSNPSTKADLNLTERTPETSKEAFFAILKTFEQLEQLETSQKEAHQSTSNTELKEEFSFADHNTSSEILEKSEKEQDFLDEDISCKDARKMNPFFLYYVLETSLKEFHETYLTYYARFHQKQTLYMEEEEFYSLLNYFSNKDVVGASKVLKIFSKIAKPVYNSNKEFEKKFQAAGNDKLSQRFMKGIFNLIKVDKFVNTGNKYSRDLVDYLKGLPIYLGFFSEVIKKEVTILRKKHNLLQGFTSSEPSNKNLSQENLKDILGNEYNLWNTALHAHRLEPTSLSLDFIAYAEKRSKSGPAIPRQELKDIFSRYMSKIIVNISNEVVDKMFSSFLKSIGGEKNISIKKFSESLYSLLEQEAERKLTKYIYSTYEQILSNDQLKSSMRSSQKSLILSSLNSDRKLESKMRDSLKSNNSKDTAESESQSDVMDMTFSSDSVKVRREINGRASISSGLGREDSRQIDLDDIELSQSVMILSDDGSSKTNGKELNKKYSKSYQPIKVSLFNSQSMSLKKRGSSIGSVYMINGKMKSENF